MCFSVCVRAHTCERERDTERESDRERARKRDLVCQGCCVSNVVVEPLQCTKTKGREGVRVRGWVAKERERERKIERGEERKDSESKIQRGGNGNGKKRCYQEGKREEGSRRDGWREREQTWSMTECVCERGTINLFAIHLALAHAADNWGGRWEGGG